MLLPTIMMMQNACLASLGFRRCAKYLVLSCGIFFSRQDDEDEDEEGGENLSFNESQGVARTNMVKTAKRASKEVEIEVWHMSLVREEARVVLGGASFVLCIICTHDACTATAFSRFCGSTKRDRSVTLLHGASRAEQLPVLNHRWDSVWPHRADGSQSLLLLLTCY